MKNLISFLAKASALMLITLSITNQVSAQKASMEKTIYSFTMTDIQGKQVSLEEFKGKVVLIVNVASECGLTPQYEDLQALYNAKSAEGLVILGFPANNFMGQEPGTDEQIATFCSSKFGVTFPMFSKIDVVGKNQHPLYQFLTQQKLNGKMDSDVTWNFQKYLIGRDGTLITSFKPRQQVDTPEVLEQINSALKH